MINKELVATKMIAHTQEYMKKYFETLSDDEDSYEWRDDGIRGKYLGVVTFIYDSNKDCRYYKENGRIILSGSLLEVLFVKPLTLRARQKAMSNFEVTLSKSEWP